MLAHMFDDDDPFYGPNAKAAPPRIARPAELLFEFLRASDRAPMACELRFDGESYGLAVQRESVRLDEPHLPNGGFVTRALAVQWAEEERAEMEGASAVRARDAVGHPAASVCPRCQNLPWICEQHPHRPWPHDGLPRTGRAVSAV
jgi:hypothetical protein